MREPPQITGVPGRQLPGSAHDDLTHGSLAGATRGPRSPPKVSIDVADGVRGVSKHPLHLAARFLRFRDRVMALCCAHLPLVDAVRYLEAG